MPKHVFKTTDVDEATPHGDLPVQGGKIVDVFAFEIGHCNGPECTVCGEAKCHHCHPEFYSEECLG